MSDEEIERELQRLRPAIPSSALLGRLQKGGATPHGRWLGTACLVGKRKIAAFPIWLPFAAAACVILYLQLRPRVEHRAPTRPATATVETFQPVETDRYLLSAEDLGVVELQPGQVYRLVHCVWADRETFRNDRLASYLEVRQSREQIVPVALETL